MKPISEAHGAQPGLAVVDVGMRRPSCARRPRLLAGRWATAPADGTPRVPGEPGVRLRCYLDVRQKLGS
ncbi:DUF6207 family protein [Streptomyces sp. NPDC057099]|uniref:DUF6207 family protein n=1 Tax=Streptomyces sp. NPDC057099 TaxID=3346019 RepID=UPI00363001EB